jgi:hypothetical protein
MYRSFCGQLSQVGGTDISGISNSFAVWMKGILFAIGIVAVVRSGNG